MTALVVPAHEVTGHCWPQLVTIDYSDFCAKTSISFVWEGLETNVVKYKFGKSVQEVSQQNSIHTLVHDGGTAGALQGHIVLKYVPPEGKKIGKCSGYGALQRKLTFSSVCFFLYLYLR